MKRDSELINEFIEDNKSKAFEEIVLRYQKIVYNACFKILRNPTDAEDAAQATFLTLIKKAKSLKNKNLLSGWLYKVAACISKNMIRTKINLKNREEKYVMENNKFLNIISNQSETKKIKVLDENSALIQEAIAALPEGYRTPIISRYFEEKPVKEIAGELGVTINVITTRINRAITKLRKKINRKGIVGISTIMLIKYLGISNAEAVPAGLTSSILSLATAGTTSAVITTASATAITAMGVFKMKTITGIILATIIIGVGGYKITNKIIENNNIKKKIPVSTTQKKQNKKAVKNNKPTPSSKIKNNSEEKQTKKEYFQNAFVKATIRRQDKIWQALIVNPDDLQKRHAWYIKGDKIKIKYKNDLETGEETFSIYKINRRKVIIINSKNETKELPWGEPKITEEKNKKTAKNDKLIKNILEKIKRIIKGMDIEIQKTSSDTRLDMIVPTENLFDLISFLEAVGNDQISIPYVIEEKIKKIKELKKELKKSKITISFDGAPLPEAIAALDEKAEINITSYEIFNDEEVIFKVKDIPLRSALTYLLEPKGLTYIVNPDELVAGPQNKLKEVRDKTNFYYELKFIPIKPPIIDKIIKAVENKIPEVEIEGDPLTCEIIMRSPLLKIPELKNLLENITQKPMPISEEIEEKIRRVEKIKNILETKRITLNFDDARLNEVLGTISKNTNINIIGNGIPKGIKINIKTNNEPLESVLNDILSQGGLDYIIVTNALMIGPSENLKTNAAKETIVYKVKTEYLPITEENSIEPSDEKAPPWGD
jgi:RNA polymerase sigma factor (sigma-70 family)